MQRRTFEIGDRINIDTCNYQGKAEIVAIRHEIGNHRTGQMAVVCDVLRADGKACYYFLGDVARMNPEAMAAGIGG